MTAALERFMGERETSQEFDIYQADSLLELLQNDELSMAEEAFMRGYLETADDGHEK